MSDYTHQSARTEEDPIAGTPPGTTQPPWSQIRGTQPTPGNGTINGDYHPTTETNNKFRLRANIRIASMNVNGATAPSENMNFLVKWETISRTIYNEKVAILAIQEAHLDETMTERIQTLYEKNLEIIVSANPESPRARAGVAFIINKWLISPEEIETHELIPGRAQTLKIKWLKTCSASILNIYAPNKRNSHLEFWATILTERHNRHLPIPDFTLGDFNVTEDAIDRMPAKLDDETAIEALRDVKAEWNMRDMWRWANPMEREFTYRAKTQTDQCKVT